MKIDAKKDYNFNQIVKNNLLGVTQRDSLKTIVIDDFISGRLILKPVKTGEGKGSSYWVKGANLIKYLNEKNEEKNQGGEKARKKVHKKSGKKASKKIYKKKAG